MEFFAVIKQRYSFRGAYQNRAVPEEHLRRIVQAGIDAPSGGNLQTTEFVIVTEQEKIRAIAETLERMPMASAPALILVICHTEPHYNEMKFWLEDCAAAAENMLLAITAFGYASCWVDGALRREGRAEKIAQMYSIPKDHLVRIILPVGIPVEPGPRKEKKPFEQRAWFNKYSGD